MTTRLTTRPTTQPTPPPSTQTSPASTSPSPAPETGASSQDDGGGNGWWWLLLAVLVVGGLAVFLLIRRHRSVRAWEDQLAAAREEVGWFARDLIPQLRRSGSVAALATGWSVAEARVDALEDKFSTLVATAHGEEQQTRATGFRDAVRTSRERMRALTVDAGQEWQDGLDEAQATLLATLVPTSNGQGGRRKAT